MGSHKTTRRKKSLVEASEIFELDAVAAKGILVFIHGFRGDASETWGATAKNVAGAPIFNDFDYLLYGFDPKKSWFDRRDVSKFVDQLQLFLLAHASKYHHIVFVTHSMGGLFVRTLVVRLLQSAEKEDRALLKKIRHAFLVACPISGSPLASAAQWAGLGFLNVRVPYLANPNIAGLDMFRAYQKAADSFQGAGGAYVDVPRFRFYAGLSDKLVGPVDVALLTEFDRYDGVLEGDHETLKLGLDGRSTLVQRIVQITQESMLNTTDVQSARIDLVKQSTQRREDAIVARSKGETTHKGDKTTIDVVLVSCSRTKRTGDYGPHPESGGITEAIRIPLIGSLALETRSKILRLVQEGKVEGVERNEGLRSAMPANQQIMFGPDFGGIRNDHRYLPAYKRYHGRGYQAEPHQWAAMLENNDRPRFLIMSGLYGLIPPDEYIQNYDVHLTDVDRINTVSIQSYWKDRELMTQILVSHLEWLEDTYSIGNVVDALSELSYQETINWALIDSRWSVLHRVFEQSAGPDCLNNIGYWIQDVINDPSILRSVRPDVFYENPRFINRDKIAFETRIGGSALSVSRENKAE